MGVPCYFLRSFKVCFCYHVIKLVFMVNFSARLDHHPTILSHKEGSKYLTCTPHFARSPQPVAHSQQSVARNPQFPICGPHTRSPQFVARSPQSVARSPHTRSPQSVARNPQPAICGPQPAARNPHFSQSRFYRNLGIYNSKLFLLGCHNNF